MKPFRLTIASAVETLFEGEALAVSIPGTNGDFQVLAQHEPLVTTIKKGEIRFTPKDGDKRAMSVEGGVVEIGENTCTVLL